MKIKNYILILTYLLLLLLISIFNYIQDPYEIFNSNPINIHPEFSENPYLPIKLSKNKKAQSVIIGGSSAKYLNIQKYKKDIADISTYYATIKDINNILPYYLDKHPEVKKIYFALELKLLDKREKTLNIKNEKYLTVQEIYKLFLSFDTTKLSIKKLLNKNNKDTKPKLINVNKEYKNKEINKIIPPNTKEEYYLYAQNELAKLFNEAKKRNIEVICFMPPFHANYQLRMYKKFNKQIKDIKKFIINETGYLIDLEIINDYTTSSFENSNKYFLDEIHMSEKYAKITNEILFNKNKDKNLYVVLDKNNIDKEFENENNKLKKYEKEHHKEYEQYRKKESQIWEKYYLNKAN